MWKAIVNSTVIDGSNFTIVVDFTDGILTYSKGFTTNSPSDTWLNQQVQDEITKIQNVQTYNKTVQKGQDITTGKQVPVGK